LRLWRAVGLRAGNDPRARRHLAVPARQEGRGIGLANKIKAYALQEAGFDTVEANEQLGLPVDARCYKAAAQVLAEMGLHEVRLLSNNPDKQNRLAKAGVKVVEMVPTEVPSRDQNIRYLQTKKDRMEHRLVLDSHVGGPVPVTTPDTSFDHEQD
jgi:GTP cyclohydrolase II